MSTSFLPLPNTCLCGCGAAVVRRYKPGHDARHKSNLRLAAIDGSESAANEMLDRNWAAFLPLQLLADLPIRNRRGQRRVDPSCCKRLLVDPTGTHHGRHNCSGLTQVAKRLGQINPITKLANQSVITRVDVTPELLSSLSSSFDQCGQCLADWNWAEVVEHVVFLRSVTVDPELSQLIASTSTDAESLPSLPPPTGPRYSLPIPTNLANLAA